MFIKLANLVIIVVGLCSFSLPKVLAKSMEIMTCSNYWVNSDNGTQECLDKRLHVVAQHVFKQNTREVEGQNGNQAYVGDHRDTHEIGSVGRERGIVRVSSKGTQRSKNGTSSGSKSSGSRGNSDTVSRGSSVVTVHGE